MARRPRVVVVGSFNADMVVETGHLPAPGETVLGRSFLMAAGGKRANQAVAAARLGAEVTLVARVGRDPFGEQAIRGFLEEGIRVDFVAQDEGSPTGVALIMVGQGGENLIAVAPGANGRLSEADVEAAHEALRRADALLLQLEIPMGAVRHAAQRAAASEVPVILNPAPATDLDDELLGLVACLTPNEKEAERLAGMEIRDATSARRAAEKLRSRGVANVLLTLGPAGCLVCTAEECRLVPACRVEAVDTTAAGDCFNGALAYALASGRELLEAVEWANAAAALSVTRRGAQPSLPTRREVVGLLTSGG